MVIIIIIIVIINYYNDYYYYIVMINMGSVLKTSKKNVRNQGIRKWLWACEGNLNE